MSAAMVSELVLPFRISVYVTHDAYENLKGTAKFSSSSERYLKFEVPSIENRPSVIRN